MFKRPALLFFLLVTLHTVFAQSQVGTNDKFADSLNALLSHTTKPADRFDLLNKLVDHNDATQGNFQGTGFGLQMHKIAQQLNNDSLLAISNNVIGNYFSGKGDFATALDYLFKDIPLAEKYNDQRRISSLYFDIAEIYFSLQNWEECLKYAKLGGDNLPEKSSPMYGFMASQYYRNMGAYFLQQKQPDSALFYIHQLEETNRRLKKVNYVMYQLTQSGTAYWQLGDNELAEVYFKKANALTDSVRSPVILLIKGENYIPYLLANKQYEKAGKYAIQLLQTGEKLNNNGTKLIAAGFLSTVYHNLHLTDSAYYYLSMQSALKDSVLSQENINKIHALAFNERIRTLDEDAQYKKEEEHRQQNIQYALIAFGIIIFITAVLLLSRTIIVNEKLISFFTAMGLLVVFEFFNMLIHPSLAHLTNDSPVLVLLALVLIAALLIPIHHRLERWLKEKMVEKNKLVRLAAAKKTIEQLEKK